MPMLQQLLAHAVIVTLALGGVACLCPAEAAGPAAAGHEHGHRAAHAAGDDSDAGCGHEKCAPDCVRVSATTAKSKAAKSTLPGKETPALDDVALLPVAFAAWPEASRQPDRSAVRVTAFMRAQDSPVRRFDCLLD